MLLDFPLFEHDFSLEIPLRIALNLNLWWIECHITHISAILSSVKLLRIQGHVLAMHLAHFLNLVKVNHKASFIGVVLLDAFSTKDGLVVRAIEVLHSLLVLLAEQTVDAFLIVVVNVS